MVFETGNENGHFDTIVHTRSGHGPEGRFSREDIYGTIQIGALWVSKFMVFDTANENVHFDTIGHTFLRTEE